jgi:hypothetical protein
VHEEMISEAITLIEEMIDWYSGSTRIEYSTGGAGVELSGVGLGSVIVTDL